ncbi:MAG: hypothetical protein ACOX47_13270 [Bacillota bacterium]
MNLWAMALGLVTVTSVPTSKRLMNGSLLSFKYEFVVLTMPKISKSKMQIKEIYI